MILYHPQSTTCGFSGALSFIFSLKSIFRVAILTESHVITTELHSFCDASELAYAAVVYLRLTTTIGTQVSLVIAKTKVSPIKRLTIPRLELCRASLLAQLHHVGKVLDVPISQTCAYGLTVPLSLICLMEVPSGLKHTLGIEFPQLWSFSLQTDGIT